MQPRALAWWTICCRQLKLETTKAFSMGSDAFANVTGNGAYCMCAPDFDFHRAGETFTAFSAAVLASAALRLLASAQLW
eukprot:g4304.t1